MKTSIVKNIDCMVGMSEFPDNYFELAIVDPPYGIKRLSSRVEISNRLCKQAKINKWDKKPPTEYFDELFRVSKNQIIWGANNFQLPTTEYFCIWNKKQTVPNFASAEYAWVSPGLKKPAKVFEYSIHQTMAERVKDGGKIHPTQKPVKLYEWLLLNYAKEGDKILDTHLGSASSRIAAHNLGFAFWGFELDKEYFEKAEYRYQEHIKQMLLF